MAAPSSLRIGTLLGYQPIHFVAGQERYRAICSAHYRRALGAVLVYDVTKESSFSSVRTWLDSLKQNGERDLVIMLVGNKIDLLEENGGAEEREVPKEAAEEFARTHRLKFIETSANTS